MSEYEPGHGKSQDVLIDILKELRKIRDRSGECADCDVKDWIYVSKEGDNSDGSSWEKAFTNLPQAVQAVPQDRELYGIKIGLGEYDINGPEDGIMPGMSRSILFCGQDRESVIITNDHTGATSVFGVNAPTIFRNLTVSAREFSRSIEFNTGANYSSIYDCDIKGRNCFVTHYMDGPTSAIQFDEVHDCHIEDVNICGEQGTTDAIEVENSRKITGTNIFIEYCQFGFHVDGSGSARNYFDNIVISDSLYGVEIGTGAHNNMFNHLHMSEIMAHTEDVSSSIIDNGYDNKFCKVRLRPQIEEVTPELTTGVTLTSNAVADTYGDWVEICNLDEFSFAPMFIKCANPSIQDGYYRVQIRIGNTGPIVAEEVIEVNGSYFMEDGKIRMNQDIEKCVISEQNRMFARCMDDGGGATIDVFLTYQRY